MMFYSNCEQSFNAIIITFQNISVDSTVTANCICSTLCNSKSRGNMVVLETIFAFICYL